MADPLPTRCCLHPIVGLTGLLAAESRGGDLVDRALSRQLVWPPAEKLSSVAESIAGHMIVSDLNDQLRPEGLPLAAALGAPTAAPAWRSAAETRGRLQSVKLAS